MKIRLLSALVGLANCFASPIFGQQKDAVDPQLRETLVALIKKYNEAFNKNDAAAVAACFTEDAIFVMDKGPVNGRQAIAKFWADEFKQFHHSNEIVTVDENSPHVIGTAGNEMWATGGWSMTVQGNDWGPEDVKGYWSVIREGDDWKIRMLTSNTTLHRLPLRSQNERVSSGVSRLNMMLGGGYFRGATVLVKFSAFVDTSARRLRRLG